MSRLEFHRPNLPWKSLLLTLWATVFLTPAHAVELKVEAILIELPNTIADPLVEKGWNGEPEPWKAVVSTDGVLHNPKSGRQILHGIVSEFSDGTGNSRLTLPQSPGKEPTGMYRVVAKNAEESIRTIRFGSKNATDQDWWSIDLASPMTSEWSFSARYRTKDLSWIVLEKATLLPQFDKRASKHFSARLLSREKPAGKETVLSPAVFKPDPDETYRIEWRYREGDVSLSHENKNSVTPEAPAKSKKKPEPIRSEVYGETIHFMRSPKGIASVIISDHKDTGSGPTRVLSSSLRRSMQELDIAPFAFRRPAEQSLVEYKGSVGEGKTRVSRLEVETLAD